MRRGGTPQGVRAGRRHRGQEERSERVGVIAGPGRAPARGGEGEGGAGRRKRAVGGG
jgi:hypothetical protein